MKSVRVWYKKTGRLRYISHLDMTRVVDRIIRRAGLPVWYTEGFNPHPHITFALPLSLGFESEHDALDIRLLDDDYPLDRVRECFAAAAPEGMDVEWVSEPIAKFKEIGYAEFIISFSVDCAVQIEDLLSTGCVTVEKKTKKGGTRTVDIFPFIKAYNVGTAHQGTVLKITLSAGNDDNINPLLFVGAVESACGYQLPVESVRRVMLYDKSMNEFA